MQNSASERKPLLRISNLKQYFPLKTKGLYVKANDGITLDIYEGETLGLVGESGCGKSTFGRTLLQLYRQTDGRTMYYGRTLDDIAPKYVGDTIRTLDKRRKQMKELEAKRDAVQKEYDGPAGRQGEVRQGQRAGAGQEGGQRRLPGHGQPGRRLHDRGRSGPVKEAYHGLQDLAPVSITRKKLESQHPGPGGSPSSPGETQEEREKARRPGSQGAKLEKKERRSAGDRSGQGGAGRGPRQD